MLISRVHGRNSSLPQWSRGRRPAPAIERLERRDCPAVVGIVGTREVSEAAGTAAFTVTLSTAETRPVSISYRVEGSATNAVDFRLIDGTSNAAWPVGTITFRPGEVSKNLTVQIINDKVRDPSETVKLSLFKPRNVTLGPTQTATLTIVDDDAFTAQIVGASRVAEGQAGVFDLVLSSPATKPETFYVSTVAGSATTNADFRPLNDLALVFNAGESRKTFRIQTVADTAVETDEFLFVRARPAAADFPRIPLKGVTIAGTGPAPLPQLTIGDATVIEGDVGTTSVTVSVALSFATTEPVTFSFQTGDGSARQGLDYQSASGVVTIPVGETSAVITVNALGDLLQEADETFTITASAPRNATISRAVGTVTIVDNDTPFRIDVVFPDRSLSPSQQSAFRLAAVRWSQIITADLPDVIVNGRVIDDLEITATGPFIDGPFGVLGQAAPVATRLTGSQLPYTGFMEFDSADLASMEANGTLRNVILHEMGHVLGLGTIWVQKNLVDATDAANPLYTGVNALREYRTLAGNPTAAGVPLETNGGPGTAGVHWQETVFDTELMTGFVEPAGVAMPISRVTVGGLADLGYTVNYAAADPYVLPAIRSGAVASRSTPVGAAGQRMTALMAQPTTSLFAAIAQAAFEATSTTSPKQKAFAAASRV